jgi:RNA-directed DNA polymerase
MTSYRRFLDALTAALLAGPMKPRASTARAAAVCGGAKPWVRAVVRRTLAVFRNPDPVQAAGKLRRFLGRDPELLSAWMRDRPTMAPVAGPPSTWALPPLPTVAALADWLNLPVPALEWFADPAARNRREPSPALHHYDYRWVRKHAGGQRLIEQPRLHLKALQRRLLRDLIARIPPHAAAHAYRPGRSPLTCAAPHCGRDFVLRFDLRDFFPGLRRHRVAAIFRTAGYPEPVARLLTGLCVNRLPRQVWDDRPDATADETGWALYDAPHLPQGAPTSPALANLCAFRLDARLTGLAGRFGATYTRYADDLVYSGGDDLRRAAGRFERWVVRVAADEGFAVRPEKTRRMAAAVRQVVVGVVVNARPNVARPDFDRLKATLTNCVRHGPAGQNRAGVPDFRAHLLGRVAHVAALNPGKGARLRTLFDRIRWGIGPEPSTRPHPVPAPPTA